MNLSQSLDLVYEGLKSVNELRTPDRAIALNADRLLTGEGGLDSLELITLVNAIERLVHQKTGQELSLAEAAFDQELGAFRTPSSLANLLVNKLVGS